MTEGNKGSEPMDPVVLARVQNVAREMGVINDRHNESPDDAFTTALFNTFMNFLKVYVMVAAEDISAGGVTHEQFVDNLKTYEEYWTSERALQFATVEEVSGATEALQRFHSIITK
jgi:hypothetical protein